MQQSQCLMPSHFPYSARFASLALLSLLTRSSFSICAKTPCMLIIPLLIGSSDPSTVASWPVLAEMNVTPALLRLNQPQTLKRLHRAAS